MSAAWRDAAAAGRAGAAWQSSGPRAFFVTSDGLRKLTTQINIEGDPLIWDDFAYATREDLIPPVVEKTGGKALGLKEDAYKEIEFNFALTKTVAGKDNQIVNRLRATTQA